VVAAAAVGGGVAYAVRAKGSAGVWPLVGGAVGLAVTAYDREDLQHALAGNAFARLLAQVGWGLNLALIASISMAAAGVVAIIQARSASAATPPGAPPTASDAPPISRADAQQPAEQVATGGSKPPYWPPPPGWHQKSEPAPPPSAPNPE
jgi:hypothetical protein